MVSIRPFEEGDNATMLDIEKLCPQGNGKYAMGVDKSPDAIARYKLYDDWKVLIAEEGGKVVGWVGWAVKHDPIQEEQYVYLAEVIVHPEYQRRGIATKLVMEAEKNARKTGSDHIYCYIFEPNDVSQALFGKLGYSNMGEFNLSLKVTQKRKLRHPFFVATNRF
uniref:Acetyltransferase YpeA n=1 Tax=Candidatus Methanogaster sp. ANME-2c ERB4 TaxID=2759911 RepID=A0A7G9YQM2_9EURY|nr:acetyltransferase YpeA [Methanosarcinales archaeon ANME-2c ERB4]QNO50306.1 acetyltransferase YpeA [Methanosarcinales archaeon ANME-2c ERB4]